MAQAQTSRLSFTLFVLLTAHLVTQSQTTDTAFQRSFYGVLNFACPAQNYISSQCSPAEKAYLTHYQLFMQQMINGEPIINYSEQQKRLSDILIKHIEEDESGHAFLSEMYLQKGIMEYVANKQSDALFSFIKGYRYWQKSESEHPKLLNNLKLSGIFNLLMSNMPQPYNRWAGWIGFSGNSQQGFAALNDYRIACDNKIGNKQDALIHLAFSYLKFNGDDKKIENLIHASHTSQLVPLSQFILARCALKIRKPSLATPWLSDSNTQAFLPMLYLKGKYQILSFDKKAKNTLLDFIEKNQSGQFTADAHRHLSWFYFLNGDTASYQQQKILIANLKAYPTWEDKQAYYENSLNSPLHKALLQSRILFDAGKYKDAADTLTTHQASIKETAQNIEFQYRLGRCYHMTNQKPRAIFHYNEAIRIGNSDLRYFAPYAALYTAELYLDDNPVTAKFYLDEAKRLNNGEHKADITQRIATLQIQLNKQ